MTAPIGPVNLRQERKKQRNGRVLERRLYQCANGLALACRRGSASDLTNDDDGSWEVAVMAGGINAGASVGFVADDRIEQLAQRLATWPGAS